MFVEVPEPVCDLVAGVGDEPSPPAVELLELHVRLGARLLE
jgi:hypothetical protein